MTIHAIKKAKNKPPGSAGSARKKPWQFKPEPSKPDFALLEKLSDRMFRDPANTETPIIDRINQKKIKLIENALKNGTQVRIPFGSITQEAVSQLTSFFIVVSLPQKQAYDIMLK